MKLLPFGTSRIGWFNDLGVWSLFLMGIKRFLAYVMFGIGSLVITAGLFMLVFSIMIPDGLMVSADIPFATFMATGLIILTIQQAAGESGPWAIMDAKVDGSIVHTLMSPLGPFELLSGMLYAAFARMLAIFGLTWLVMLFFTPIGVSNIAVLAFFFFAGAIMIASVSFLVSIWAKNWDQEQGVTALVLTPLMYLGAPFYELEKLPEPLSSVGRWNPFYWMTDGMRYGFTGHASSDLLVSGTLLSLCATVSFVAVYSALKTGWKLRH